MLVTRSKVNAVYRYTIKFYLSPMLSESERYFQNEEMLRKLALGLIRPRVQQKLFYPICSKNVPMTNLTRAMSNENPQNLPALPVPDLNKTVETYIKSVEPFLNKDELATTVKVFKKFAEPNGVGQKLQEFLLCKAKNTVNWLEQWWLDVAYLSYRDPVVVYSSPGQTIPFTTFGNEDERLCYTSKLIVAAASYKMMIDSKKIPVDKMGKAELDMNQYNKIFGTSRIPNSPKDDIEFNPKSTHIIVAHNNHFFKLDLFNNNGEPLSEKQVFGQLEKLLCESDNPTEPVGILSTENRDNWSKAYKTLVQDPNNLKSAKEIQTSLFLVCLDAPCCPIANDDQRTTAGKQLIHGCGSEANSGNRWYDKTVQFVLGTDGIVGLTYEHSPSEGQPIAVMVDYLHNFITKDAGSKVPDGSHDKDPVKLAFNVDAKTKTAINTAKANIDKLANNLELTCFEYNKYGKEFIKSQKLSPDSYFQMVLQFSYYRLHKKPAAHYESAATRKYVGGRTETIRSCSIESVAFVKAMLDPTKSDGEKAKALRTAINSHKTYSVEAVNGFGVDRHLLGLKLAAAELQQPIPDIYKDPSFVRSTHMVISSSQVATKCDGFMCYGPLVPDGYGCCYNPRDDTINISISAFANNSETSATKFRAAVESSLADMQQVLLKTQTAKM